MRKIELGILLVVAVATATQTTRASSVADDVAAKIDSTKVALEKAFAMLQSLEVQLAELEESLEQVERVGEVKTDEMRESLGGNGDVITAVANLQSINGSGIKATIAFVDDATTLSVEGTATGLDPNESYVTLIYDNGSVPGGPNACAPTIFDPQDPDFILGTMLIGFWDVDSAGNGTISAVNTNFGADFVPLNKFRSTSVRLVTGPPPAPDAPPMTELVACGHVATRGSH